MQFRPPSYSVILGICCLGILSGCFRSATLSPEDEARASLALSAAEDRYGVIRDPESQNYLYYLSARLTSALARVGKSCDGCNITLLDTDIPLAYSPGPGHIVISRGLMTKLHNEAELAFVVSHEMAHQILGHHAALKGITIEESGSQRIKLEQEADHFAVGLVALAGYDPRFAPGALLHAYGKVTSEGSSVGYPELYEREALLEDEIMDAKWSPPGTIDRREFQKLRRDFSVRR